MLRTYIYFVLILCVRSDDVVDYRNTFDMELYERVLDKDECAKQLKFLSKHRLGLSFVDASAKIPSGILTGNINDLGDYYECLSIDETIEDMEIQGKYCSIIVPWEQKLLNLPDNLDSNWMKVLINYQLGNRFLGQDEDYKSHAHELSDTMGPLGEYYSVSAPITKATHLGLCIPKVCTTSETINHGLSSISFVNVSYRDFYCRLPNDKPFKLADYVSMVIFSIIGLLTVISTTYDVYNLKILNKEARPIYRSFSIYHNTKRLLTFNRVPGQVDCLDGIRALSMLWVVLGHTFMLIFFVFTHNGLLRLQWLRQMACICALGALLAVDTFLAMTGILLVFSVIGHASRSRFLKGLPIFYLYRLLRIWPLLAVTLLLNVSVFHHISDGPFWNIVAVTVEACRQDWWKLLVFIQNQKDSFCLVHCWYLAVDFQLYLVSPVILIWLFGKEKFAWMALTFFTLVSLGITIGYSYTLNLTSLLFKFATMEDAGRYINKYYINTLPRAPPFVIGMLFGYILHIYRDKKLKISKLYVALFWLLSFMASSFCIFSMNFIMQEDYDNQAFDNFYNAFARSFWACMIGWIVLACAHGYGGPINWFLSLNMWKLPARLSYAMYLIHLPILIINHGNKEQAHYLGVAETIQRFFQYLFMTVAAAFMMCVVIDAPCSTLQKLMLGLKKSPKVNPKEDKPETVEDGKFFKTAL